jgi:hypothetical protein
MSEQMADRMVQSQFCHHLCWFNPDFTRICVGSILILQRFVLVQPWFYQDLCWFNSHFTTICVGSTLILQRFVLVQFSFYHHLCWFNLDFTRICVGSIPILPPFVLVQPWFYHTFSMFFFPSYGTATVRRLWRLRVRPVASHRTRDENSAVFSDPTSRGKPWWVPSGKRLHIYITMERSTIFNG